MIMLTADIGGTNSRFSLFLWNGSELSPGGGIVLSSRQDDFAALLDRLFSCWPVEWTELSRASLLVFAAAGPVRNGSIALTNASFAVDEEQCRNFFPDAQVWLMNDFEAQAWACLSPVMREAECLLPAGEEVVPTFAAGKPVAVVGAGTGLGAAWLLPGAGDTAASVLPSEAGHMPFPFDESDEEERAFAGFMRTRRGTAPVTAEHVLSGSGLTLLFEHRQGRTEVPEVFTSHPDFAGSDVCRLFARFYGRFCRMAALALLPQGIVVTGGVAEKSPALVRHAEFRREFLRAEGDQGAFLAQVPVWLNRHPQSGLWGAACAGTVLAARPEAR